MLIQYETKVLTDTLVLDCWTAVLANAELRIAVSA
jgi:hypothetical protein